jgi:leucyl-tRNA synthetase
LSDTPPERDIEWTEAGIEGSWRFTQRIWRIVHEIAREGAPAGTAAPSSIGGAALGLRQATHRALAAVTDDLASLRFNRSIARIYELANAISGVLQGSDRSPAMQFALREAGEILALMFAPMMPHLAEECWTVLKKSGLVAKTAWPKADPALVAEDEITIAVQVNGKRRDEVRLPKGLPDTEVEAAVLKLDNVRKALDGKQVKKVIVVKDRIANVVCR